MYSFVYFCSQVCPTGVPEDRATEEYSKMAEVLIEAATTATPQLPLTALLVQVTVLFWVVLCLRTILKSFRFYIKWSCRVLNIQG